jgi:limonene-1,2-epoxide hydrolase
MSTQQTADKLVAFCREGKNIDAINELYDDNVVSHESTGEQTEFKGKQAVLDKNTHWYSSVEEVHSAIISDPIIAGSFFTVSMIMDVTYKGAGRMKMEEIAVYEVEDGKIVFEQFFYGM